MKSRVIGMFALALALGLGTAACTRIVNLEPVPGDGSTLPDATIDEDAGISDARAFDDGGALDAGTRVDDAQVAD